MKVQEDQTTKNAGRAHSPCMNQNILDGFYAEPPEKRSPNSATVQHNIHVFKCWARNRAVTDSHMVL